MLKLTLPMTPISSHWSLLVGINPSALYLYHYNFTTATAPIHCNWTTATAPIHLHNCHCSNTLQLDHSNCSNTQDERNKVQIADLKNELAKREGRLECVWMYHHPSTFVVVTNNMNPAIDHNVCPHFGWSWPIFLTQDCQRLDRLSLPVPMTNDPERSWNFFFIIGSNWKLRLLRPVKQKVAFNIIFKRLVNHKK